VTPERLRELAAQFAQRSRVRFNPLVDANGEEIAAALAAGAEAMETLAHWAEITWDSIAEEKRHWK
jgi:hypothetical protein